MSLTDEESLIERGRVRYDSNTQQFQYTFDYEIPASISELTIDIRLLGSDTVSVRSTRNVTRESDTSFVWRGGTAPQVVIARRVGGETFTSGVSGTYAADGVALAGRIATRLPFRYRGTAPTRHQTLTFEGEGFASDGYVYAGPHEAYTRTVAGTQLGVVVPAAVDTTVPHEALLDAYAFGERTISRRLPRSKMTAFVIPPHWYRRRGVAVGTDVLLHDSVATVDSIRSVATHEYIHTGFGVFGSGEMYWLKEAIAEYFGYLLALNAGAGSFAEFQTAVTATRHRDSTLTDSETMRTTSADYEKGAHVLAALDAAIREHSGGQAILNDALTTGDYNLSTYDGFRTAVTQTAGSPILGNWIEQYVRSPAIPEIPTEPQYFVLGDRTAASFQTATATPTQSGTGGPWHTETANTATVEATADAVTIRVENCARGTATRALGIGPVTVSFDYEIDAEGWWERPYCELLADDTVVWTGSVGADDYDERIFEITAGGTTTGRVVKPIARSGPLAIRLGIAPSNHCSSPDHGQTTLRVRNFEVEPQAATAAASTGTPHSTVTPTSTATATPPSESAAGDEATTERATSAAGPGFDLLGTLGSLGGAGYLLARRLGAVDAPEC